MNRTTTTAWPADVLTRHLTIGGATADVIDTVTDNRPAYLSTSHEVRGACTGERCNGSHYTVRFTFSLDDDPEQDEDFQQAIAQAQWWARTHAEKCRAMPRP